MKDKFREWLSDNLRYIMLGAGILVVVLAIFFGVKFLTERLDGGGKDGSGRTEATPTPTPAESVDEEEDAVLEEQETLEPNGNAQLSELMNTYYTALGSKDIETLKTVVDQLSEAEQAKIEEETYIEGYSDIVTYTFDGQTEGTYVVIAGYNCKYKEVDTVAPGLSQMYVYTDTEGKLVIAAEIEDETVTGYMTDLQNRPEVRKLIEDTQEAYNTARASDAKLDALISSVAGA